MLDQQNQQSRTPAFLLVFLLLLVPCTAFVSSQENVGSEIDKTHAPAILVDGLPPLMCGDDICERPLREYDRDGRYATREYGSWQAYGPDLDWNGMDDRLQYILDGEESISPTAIIGPDGNYKNLPDISKWILATGMLLGRLELFAVLVLFFPSFWRN